MATLLVPSQFATVQAAINAAVAGDVIKCAANQLFTGQIVLKNKGILASYITITTDAASGSLPPAGYRTNPSYATFMPRLQSPGAGLQTVVTESGANHYKFQHIEFPEVPQGFSSIMALGTNDSTQQFASQEPTDMIVDQCWFHGGLICGQKNAIAANGRRITISNSYFSDIKSVGQDAVCIGGQNGHGPLTVTNNYLSGGTEPFILGGSDPWIRTLMTVTGAVTSTSAVVTCSVAGHTLAELTDGQALSVKVGTTDVFTTLRTHTTGASGTLTFDDVGGIPATPGALRAGVVLGMEGPAFGLTFRKNYVRNDPAWIDGILPTVSGVVATPIVGGGGTLAAGTKYYTVQAVSTGGYQGSTSTSAESTETPAAVLSATGHITVAWNAGVTGTTSYKVWRGVTPGARTQFISTTSLSIDDNGTLGWTNGTPGAATEVQIKNLFELKAVQNAQVDSNIFENVWRSTANPSGQAWWIKSVNQDGNGTFIQSKDIVFEANWIRHGFGFAEAHGREIPGGSGFGLPGPLSNVIMRNNLLTDSGALPWSRGSSAYAMAFTDSIVNFTLDHNTVDHQTNGGGGLLVVDSAGPDLVGFVVTNNMFRRETFGIHDSFGSDKAALDLAAPGYSWQKNSTADSSPGTWPVNNFYPTLAAWKNEFVDYVGGDFHIKGTSTLSRAGLDGKDIGADINLITQALINVTTGTPDLQGVVSTIMHNSVYPPTPTINAISLAATSWAGTFIELAPIPTGVIIFGSSST